LEEVAVRAGHEVLLEVDDHSALIVGDPRGILGQQFRPQPIHFLSIILILVHY
jgi:hypothetical protein